MQLKMSSFLYLKRTDAKRKRANAISDRHLIGQLSSGGFTAREGAWRVALGLAVRRCSEKFPLPTLEEEQHETASRSQAERRRLERGLPGTQLGLHRRGAPPDDSNVSTSRLRIGGSGPVLSPFTAKETDIFG